MNYKTVKEASKEWDITERRIIALCAEGRIKGAEKFGWSWAIPIDAEKPSDGRKKMKSNNESKAKRKPIFIDRIWAMPNKHTFTIRPIRELILEEMNGGLWIDPFAGPNKLADITNDLNPEYDTDFHLDALDFLKQFDDESVDGILYDPPYSPRQVSECYNDVGYNVTWDMTKASFWGKHKREISRILRVGGKVITFGWNSGGIGMKYGCEINRIRLVPHGGWHNDTICTVETKVRNIEPPTKSKTGNEEKNLTNTDKKLIKELQSLPADYWDFRTADTKELTHGLHNYPAVMVYPISRNIIRMVKELMPVSSFLDPFAGSGTGLVEALLGDIPNIYGNDLNPLAKFLSEVKTTPIDKSALIPRIDNVLGDIEQDLNSFESLINEVNDYVSTERGFDITEMQGWGNNAPAILEDYLSSRGVELEIPNFKNIGYWFKPEVILSLQIIKNNIMACEEGDFKQFLWLSFSEVVRSVSNRRSGEFKMFRRPVNTLKSYLPDVFREFSTELKSNTERMIAFSELCNKEGFKPKIHISDNDARQLDYVPDDSIDLLVTSPPYGDSRTTVAYGEFSRVSLQWIEIEDLEKDAISSIDRRLMGGEKFRNGFEMTLDSPTLRVSLEKIAVEDIERAGDVFSFYEDLNDVIKATAKKMRSGGYQFWVVGNRTVKLETLQTNIIVKELAAQYGLTHVYTVGRMIPNKVMPSANSPTNEAGKTVATMTNEHIVILRKE